MMIELPTKIKFIKREDLTKNNDLYELVIEFNVRLEKLEEIYDYFSELEYDRHLKKEMVKKIISNMFSRRNTVGTETIEGSTITSDDISLNENIDKSKKAFSSEMLSTSIIYHKYLNLRLRDKPITTSFIKELHKEIFEHEDVNPGKYKMQNNRPKNSSKIFVNWKLVSKIMEEICFEINTLEYRISNDCALTIANIGIIHAYLVGIHPFKDGNGRLMRLITDKMISREFDIPLFISEELAIKKTEYFNALDKYHQNHDYFSIAKLFLQVSISQLKTNEKIINDLLIKIRSYLNDLTFINSKYHLGLIKLFITQPWITNKHISDVLNLGNDTSAKIISLLIEKKWLHSKPCKVGRFLMYRSLKWFESPLLNKNQLKKKISK